MTNYLEVKNLSKSFDNFQLHNITFALPKGYIMGLIGPNGSGKTTTIKLILNMLKRNGGEIRIMGLDNIADEQKAKAELGVVFDTNYFSDDWQVAQVGKSISVFPRVSRTKLASVTSCVFFQYWRNSAGVIILGFSTPDSKKSLSPVSKTSAFASMAARRIGRSFTSRICVSEISSSVGIGTNSKVRSAIERNLSNDASLVGNFLLNIRFISSTFCSQISP